MFYLDILKGDMIGNSHRNDFSIVGIGSKSHRDYTWIIYM